MAAFAIGLLASYFAVAFGLRMFLQWRLFGSTGFHGVQGPVGSLEWFAGVLPGVAVAGSAASPVLVLCGVLAPMKAADSPVIQAAGAILFAFGLAVTFAAQLKMGRSWRIGVKPDEKTQLVTSGLFSLVRNPIYSAMLIAFLGIVLLVPTALAAGSWILLLATVEFQVRFVEEPYLRRAHPDSYARYARRVGRFLPRFPRNLS